MTTAPPPAEPPPAPRRTWKTWHVLIAALAGLVLGVGVGGMTSDDEPDTALEAVSTTQDDEGTEDSDRTTTTRDRAEADETTTTTAARAKTGSRDNPHPLGSELRSDDGLVVVVDAVRFDAWPEIQAVNSFNEPAPEGFTYVLMTFTIRNETDEPLQASWALDIGLIGSANRMYDATNAYCDPVIPNPLYDGGELYPGGSYQGNECLQVPTAEIEDGSLVLAVTPMMSFDDPVFVATR